MVDLSVDFGVDDRWVPAAKKLNYTVRAGEVLAIVGESGSGKSASSMAILDLLPKNSRITGQILLRGRDLRTAKPPEMRRIRGKEVAAIFQEPMTALNPVYTVGFQIIETLRIHEPFTPSQAKTRALELLDMVELPDPMKAFNSYPHQLSGGQRQRAMIAQSISCDPSLLIADEPTTALDVTVQAEILDLMRNLKDQLDSAILLITHDMGVVADLADDIVVMRLGEIVERGPVAQIFDNPQHPYTQKLLAAVPHLGQTDQADAIDTTAALLEEVATISVEVKEGDSPWARPVNDAIALPDPEKEPDRPLALELVDVAIEYPKRGRVPAFRAVDGANLRIHTGEIVGLVGESGSGKSTIGRAAVGLLPVAEGRLTVVDHDITKADRKLLREVHKKVGVVFQDPSSSLNPRLPISESIGEPLLLSGAAKGEALQRRVEEMLDSVELPRSYRNRYPHELSGGQKQRVGIARALSLRPNLLIADEPTSALDVSVQATVLELLKDLQREFQFACLFVSHDLAVIDIMSDRIVVMSLGKIVEQGTRDEILRTPKDPYTQRLLAAVPVPDPEAQRQRREVRAELAALAAEAPA